MINYYEPFVSLQDKSNSKYYFYVLYKFEEELKNEFNLTLTDKKYLNSKFNVYNSKIDFKIKELKGWKFRIYFDTTFNNKKNNEMNFQIMWAYELFIAELKPETCIFNFKLCFSLKRNKFLYDDEMLKFCDMLYYVKYYPYLAIYRDIYDTDYNVFYVSKYKAKKVVKSEIRKYYLSKKLQEKQDKICLKWLKRNVLNKYKNKIFLIEKKNNNTIKYQLITSKEFILNKNNDFEFSKNRLWFKHDLMKSYKKLSNKICKNKKLYYVIPFKPFILEINDDIFMKTLLYNKNINL